MTGSMHAAATAAAAAVEMATAACGVATVQRPACVSSPPGRPILPSLPRVSGLPGLQRLRGLRGPARLPALALAAVLLAVAALPSPGHAQVPPTAAEVARFGPLHAAAHRGDLPVVERLARDPALRDARDPLGRTPLHVATFAGRRDAVRALQAAGADTGALEHGRYDAVTIAAVAGDEETLRVLLAGGASARRVTSRYDGTALIAAAHLGHAGVVRQLLAAGAPVDHVNNLGWTALIESIVLGDGGPRHLDTLRALLDAGADPRIADRSGRTPLQLARDRGHAAMVQALEAAKARTATAR